jgi:class 3 adenylate cyclase
LACRVGIATGVVVVGELVDRGAAQERTVVGPPPNLVARLQEAAGPGEIMIAEMTRRLLGSGRTDVAYQLWSRLLAVLPAGAPERPELARRLAALKPAGR